MERLDHGKDQENAHQDHAIELTIVVNGEPAKVKAELNQPLRTVIPKALEETGNVGQALENWELKDDAGTLLDLAKKFKDFGFTDETVLFLSLKAGVAGA